MTPALGKVDLLSAAFDVSKLEKDAPTESGGTENETSEEGEDDDDEDEDSNGDESESEDSGDGSDDGEEEEHEEEGWNPPSVAEIEALFIGPPSFLPLVRPSTEAPQTEPHFGTLFWQDPLPDSLLTFWQDTGDVSDDSDLHLPPRNPFLPSSLELLPELRLSSEKEMVLSEADVNVVSFDNQAPVTLLAVDGLTLRHL